VVGLPLSPDMPTVGSRHHDSRPGPGRGPGRGDRSWASRGDARERHAPSRGKRAVLADTVRMHPARFAVLVEIAPAPQHDEAFFRRPSARGRRARCRGFSCSVATVEVLGASTCHSHRSQRLHCVSRLRGHGKAHPVQLLAVQPWPRASPRTWTSGCCAKHSSHIVGKKLIADPGIAPTPFTQLQIPVFWKRPPNLVSCDQSCYFG
jgi:hypothetical protein